MSRWLTMEEASNYGRMGRPKLMELIRSGQIYGTKRTGKWLIDKESIDRFLFEEDLEDSKLAVDVEQRAGIK